MTVIHKNSSYSRISAILKLLKTLHYIKMGEEFPIKQITISDDLFPALLKQIPNPPRFLFYRGELAVINAKNCLSIVGSRNITSYGISVVDTLLTGLADKEVTVISGFMRGVDFYAHDFAIKNRLPTVAVLPCGLTYSYSFLYRNLYDKILHSGGAILSEYPDTYPPKDWTFVKRNRIVAGISGVLLLIEAGKNSGSLITYDYAKKYKRKILAVPGDIFRSSEEGICQVLNDCAKPVFSATDIAREMGIAEVVPISYTSPPFLQNDPVALTVMNAIAVSSCDISTLCKITQLTFSDISSALLTLELKNIVKEIKGIYYVVKS